jgi:hypothetical protein
MMLPSLDYVYDSKSKKQALPKIYVLEIRPRTEPTAAPIAWLLIEREEHYRRYDPPKDNSIWEASITLNYRRIVPTYARQRAATGSFSGAYSRPSNTVSITSPTVGTGAVFLDLPDLDGNRIGTYLMNQIVAWVRQWPDADVATVEVSSLQANGENKERRNRLYEQFGLVFDYTDDEHRDGRSRPMLASALTPVATWEENTTEHHLFDYMGDLLYTRQQAVAELTHRQNAVDFLRAEQKVAEAHPLRWASRRLWWRYRNFVIGTAVIATLATLALAKHIAW